MDRSAMRAGVAVRTAAPDCAIARDATAPSGYAPQVCIGVEMIGLPSGTCRNCEAPVSYFAPRCPHCGAPNLPNPVATVVVLLAVLLIGGSIVLGVLAFRGSKTPLAPDHADSRPPGAERTGDASDDYGWIVNAMAECEEEAKVKTDTLHFLIVPVTATGTGVLGWSPIPISRIGDSATLLTWTDTLIGLRNRVLSLYQKPLGFAATDPMTGTTYKWKPSTGVTSLKTRSADTDSLKLGLEIPEVSSETIWGPTIQHNKGTCHWINALIRPARSPGAR
jgi:hypothetical protein